jgi:aspartyl-tRNA(Asn)/glutamyl-tRNA(Gln) amidotransferase subunit B
LEQAINYEIERQSQALQNGEQLNQETRGWNTAQNKTFLQRTKEEAEDYRYFPDPDLPPIRLSTNQIEIIKQNLPELPLERAKRWMSNYHLQPEFATRLSEDTKHAQQLDSLFKLAVNKKFEPSKLANQIVNKKITVNYQNLEATLAEFESLNATATVDDNDLEKIIRQVLAEHQDAVNRYHAGQKQVLGFFMGQVMKNLKVKADPQQVRSTLHKYLDN